MSRDEAGLRHGLTDLLAARVADPDGAGFAPDELAVLRARPLMHAATADDAVAALRCHFDDGQIGQIVHAHGLYRGLHTTLATLGAEILDGDGRPLSERSGFGVVTMADGSMIARGDVALP